MAGKPKLFDFRRMEVERAFQESAERVRQNLDMENPFPVFDPKQAAEKLAEEVGGRDAGIYAVCMERHGFVFWPARKLPRINGVVPQAEGQWRHAGLQIAFTPTDLARQFPGGPEEADRWIDTEKKVRRLVRLGAPADARARARAGR
jgi:hypothetical protein